MILRFLFLLPSTLLLWAIQTTINHHIAEWQLGIFLGSLMVCHAAFRMQPVQGLVPPIP